MPQPVTVPLLDLKAQYATIRDEIRAAVDGVLESQQCILGPVVADCEAKLAEYCRCPYAVTVSSGSDALLVSLMAEDIGPGEKLYEELYFDDEETLPTSHPKLRAAYHRPYALADVHRAVAQLERIVNDPEELLRRKLREIVPEFNSPSGHADEKEPLLTLEDQKVIVRA